MPRKSEVLTRFNRMASRYSLPLAIDFLDGKGRVSIKTKTSTAGLLSDRCISPRLSMAQLDIWLDGFEEALDLIVNRPEDLYRPESGTPLSSGN